MGYKVNMQASRFKSKLTALIGAAVSTSVLVTQPAAAKDDAADVKPAECFILLHGLTRSPASMRKLETTLTAHGYFVVNQGYDSRSDTVEALAQPTIEAAISECGDADTPIHFVTHSLGSILLCQYLTQRRPARLGRVVMLGPPNKGGEVTDKISSPPGYSWLNGPAGEQLGTGTDSLTAKLGPADFDVGIIAGDRSINLILSTLIPDRDDGKVSVENTKLTGMNDHITLPVSHPFLMRNKKALSQIVHYLSAGEFRRTKPVQSQ